LVHAGNEARQQGWRHSRPYIQIAESNLNQAAVSIEQCYKQPVVQTVVKEVVVEKVVERIVQRVVDVPAPAKPAVELPFNLATTVLFNYNKRDLAEIRPFTKTLLDDFVAKIKQANISGVPFKVQSIQVIGHADRTNNTGIPNYNSLLAQDRAEVIKQYLVSKGIAQTVVTSTVMGDTQQVEACNDKFKTKAELQECLLPNRRVEVVLNGLR
jgi:outer membrane protein OmpA-like peptidoglycan-associated protein